MGKPLVVEEVGKPYHEAQRNQLFGLVSQELLGSLGADPSSPAAGEQLLPSACSPLQQPLACKQGAALFAGATVAEAAAEAWDPPVMALLLLPRCCTPQPYASLVNCWCGPE